MDISHAENAQFVVVFGETITQILLLSLIQVSVHQHIHQDLLIREIHTASGRSRAITQGILRLFANNLSKLFLDDFFNNPISPYHGRHADRKNRTESIILTRD